MNQGPTVFGFDLGAWLDRLPPWGLPAIILYGAMIAALLVPVAVALGRARAGWTWALLLLLPGIGLLVLAVMFMARVLPRARWSPAFGLLLLLPPISIFFAWIFAFAPWTKAHRPLAVDDLSKQPPGRAKPAAAPTFGSPAAATPAVAPPAAAPAVAAAPAPKPAMPAEPVRPIDAEMDVKTGVRRAQAASAIPAPAEPTLPPAALRQERPAPPALPPVAPVAPPALPAAARPPSPAVAPPPQAAVAPPPQAVIEKKSEAPTLVTAGAPPAAALDARTVQMSGPAEGGRAWRLIGANDRSAALEFTLAERDLRNAEAGILVGRSRGAGIVIADESVSRNHARFVLGEGALAVEDLDSMNGTWVNGQKLEANAPVKLATEAIVEFGKIRLLVTDA